MDNAREVETPPEIKDLLWEVVPEDSEFNDPISLHNTQILAAFIRGQQSGSTPKPLEVRR